VNKNKKHTTNTHVVEGKAYWFISYTKDQKKYVSYVFNNDCNHCYNEIKEAYKRYLIMNDYFTNVNTVSMTYYHDVSREKLNERRDDEVYKRKQQGYSIVNVNFSYSED
jgi:hypothetical protein